MLKHRSFLNFLPTLLLAVGAYAQTAAAPPGLTLAQAVDQALKNNLQTNLAQERTTESRAQRGIGLSALLPNVSGAAYQMNLTENLAAKDYRLPPSTSLVSRPSSVRSTVSMHASR